MRIHSPFYKFNARAAAFLFGGADIGSGGQGTVYTMDDLPGKTRGWDEMTLVTVDLKENRVVEKLVTVKALAAMVTGVVFKGALGNAGMHPGGIDAEPRAEFETNMTIVRLFAERGTSSVEWIVLARDSPLIFIKNRYVVIGLKAPNEVKSTNQRWFPLYKRMVGDLKTLYHKHLKDELTAQTPLEAAVTMLKMLGAMRRVGVHHCDIKEENMLFDVEVCEEKGGKSKEPCRMSFALADYGLAKANPTRVSTLGTAGSVSPLMFPGDATSRAVFLQNNEVPGGLVKGDEIWDSYDKPRKSMTNIRENASVGDKKQIVLVARALEKNDVFALGVMFAHLEGSPALADLARRLLLGAPRASASGKEAPPIWTIDEALRACTLLLSNAPQAAKRLRFTLED
jgi:serine/threonine protein kinase